MRHRKRGRHLGRTSSHRVAMLRNLASALFLTERDAEFDPNPPKVKGASSRRCRRPRKSGRWSKSASPSRGNALVHRQAAEQFGTAGETRNGRVESSGVRAAGGRNGARPVRPVVAAQRHLLQLLGDKQAVQVLFAEVAPRFAESRRRLHAHPAAGHAALGRRRHACDAGVRGSHDRVAEAERATFVRGCGRARPEPAAASAESRNDPRQRLVLAGTRLVLRVARTVPRRDRWAT